MNLKMSLKHESLEVPQNFSTLSDTMHTPARFKILKELQELKNLIKNLTCSCSDNEVLVSNYSMEDSENNSELLLTLNLFQLVIMIGLVIALMCNFYSIKEPGWKQIAMVRNICFISPLVPSKREKNILGLLS